MTRKTKKQIIEFISIFMVVIAATIIVMPKANVHARTSDSTAHQPAKANEFYIQKVDEDGNQIDGAEFTIKAEWIYGYYGEPGAPFNGDKTDNITIGKEKITNAYLDDVASGDYYDSFFTFDGENEAKLTITETKAPDDYEELSSPIEVKYYYENTGNDPTIMPYPAGHGDDYQYELKIEITSDPDSVCELDTTTDPNTDGTIYTLKIINKKPKYSEKYSYEGDLPDDVMTTLPTRAGEYGNDTEVVPEAPKSTTVKVGKTTYTFNGWNPTSVIIDGKDAEFVGTWTAKEDPDEDTDDNDDDGASTTDESDSSDNDSSDTTAKETSVVKTADNTDISFFAIIFITAISSVLALLFIRKKHINTR